MITIIAGENQTFIFCDTEEEKSAEVLKGLGKEIIEMAEDEERFEHAGEIGDQEEGGYSECIESEYDKRIYQEDLHLDGRPEYMRLLKFQGNFADAVHAMQNGLAVRRKSWGDDQWLEMMDTVGAHDDIYVNDVLIVKCPNETYDCYLATDEDRFEVEDWGLVGALKYRLKMEQEKYREDIVTDDEKRILGNFIKSRKFFHDYIMERGSHVLFSTDARQKLFEEISSIYIRENVEEIAYQTGKISDKDLWLDCVMASDIGNEKGRNEK